MPTRPAKLLPIYLPADEYAELRRKARAEERDPIQQARWLLRAALAHKSDDGSQLMQHRLEASA